ncbi:hypothetical protein SPBR_02079 [Sporothrix brasiliensis 5110]|uniref:Cyanovirin-N domain-containing protein n=1 Tax=Sporothrix brasiliensis 5110 TaxID=1398154 RepID=A0A0C2J4G7_9PEZI|nr:uncharacterized protein SPBR_02079 [Sporothrix brasiliensis 5110]KIH91972.1 hypothetical protein SPBR_02079 [Sporothrix brasiliensis 5110]
MASPSRTRTSSLLCTVAVAAFAASACAAPSLTPALADLEVRASVAKTNFGASCTNIAYFGYCRIEADCTSDGSDVTDKNKGSLQHTFLDMGQCIGYDAPSKALKWRSKSVAHWQSTYCAPCSHCTIDPKTTQLTCQCQYADATSNHATYLTLSDHVSNTAGVLSCLNVAGDRDHND